MKNVQMFPQNPHCSGEGWVVGNYQWDPFGGSMLLWASHFGKSMTPSRAVCPLDHLHSFWPKDGHSILPLVSWSQNNVFISHAKPGIWSGEKPWPTVCRWDRRPSPHQNERSQIWHPLNRWQPISSNLLDHSLDDLYKSHGGSSHFAYSQFAYSHFAY